MTPELIAILGVGTALAGILLATRRDINTRLDRVEARIDRVETRMDRLETRIENLETRMDRLETRMDRLETRMDQVEVRMEQMDGRLKSVELGQAKLEGLLEGLREAIAGRRPADTAA